MVSRTTVTIRANSGFCERRNFFQQEIFEAGGLEDAVSEKLYVTGFVKIDPNHTGTEIYFIAEH